MLTSLLNVVQHILKRPKHSPKTIYFSIKRKDMKDFYWLNEDSRTFLSRGYLSEGETPESRIRDIANTAENI